MFPGNTQGRTIRETGPKGAVIVAVEDAQVVNVERVELDVLRWARVEVDCTDATADAVPGLMRASLLSAWQSNVAGLPLVVRVSLTGQTAEQELSTTAWRPSATSPSGLGIDIARPLHREGEGAGHAPAQMQDVVSGTTSRPSSDRRRPTGPSHSVSRGYRAVPPLRADLAWPAPRSG